MLAAIAGGVLIALMPLTLLLRCAIAAVFLSSIWLQLRRLSRRARSVDRIRIGSNGEVRVVDALGDWQEVTLLPGSLATARWAWLRIRFPDGANYAELLRGDAVKDLQWHRFQLVWRQCRQIFGRRDGS